MRVSNPRYSFRVAPDGQLVVEIIFQLVQKGRRHNGVTVIAAADGSIRYVIPNQPRPKFDPPPKGAESQVSLVESTPPRPGRGIAPFFLVISSLPERYRRLYPELARLARDVPTPSWTLAIMVDRTRPTNGLEQPAKRPLKIFAFDPMLARLDSTRAISIKVRNEPLRPGPQGTRVEVIDYDGVNRCFYPAVDLDDPRVLMRGGLDPAEADPDFISRWSTPSP